MTGPTGEQAARLVAQGHDHGRSGRNAEASEAYACALAFGPHCPDRPMVLVFAAQTQMALGEWTTAMDLVQEARAAADLADDVHATLAALGALGQLQKRNGEFGAALASAREGYERATRVGDDRERVLFKQDEAFALDLLDDLDGAIRAAVESHEIAEKGVAPELELSAIGRVGSLLRRAGRLDEALQIAESGLARARELGDPVEEADFQLDIGIDRLERGLPEEAYQAFRSTFLVYMDNERLEKIVFLVQEITNRSVGPEHAEHAWLAARAATAIGLDCGEQLRTAVEPEAVRAVITAARLGSREQSVTGTDHVTELLTAGTPTGTAPVMAVLAEVTGLVVLWLHDQPLDPHRETVRAIDQALGGTPLADLLATRPG